MPLQARLDAFKADFEAGKPPYSVLRRVIETMHRATTELVALGAGSRDLKAGDTAPPFVLNDANGNVVPASALLAQLLAISPQNVANSRESMRDNGLDFPILSDPSKETAAACGLRVALPGYLADVYKSRKNDLPAFNGDTSWTLPMPGHFVIGQDGIIRYAEINRDYTRRPEPSDMLPVLRTQGRPVSHSGAARPGLVPAALPTSKCTT